MIKTKYFECLIWFALSIFLGIKSIQLELGTFSSPGPGFMPFAVALTIFILSLILLIEIYFSREKSAVKNLNLKMNSLLIIFSMIVYIFVFKKIGYILSSFLLWTLIFKFVGTKRWMWTLIESTLVTFLSYLIFGVALKLNLPTGFFFF